MITRNKPNFAEEVYDYISEVLFMKNCPRTLNSAIFNVLRILKGVHPRDTYLENYLWHYAKRGDAFWDYYHLIWFLGANVEINKVLEIGSRTGISICQFLSACITTDSKEVVLCDLFNDDLCSTETIARNFDALNIPLDIATCITGDSTETVPEYRNKNPRKQFDYILVDGGHDQKTALTDLMNVARMLSYGGVLIFDDIAEDGCSLDGVWKGFKADFNSEFYFLENYQGKGFGVGVYKQDPVIKYTFKETEAAALSLNECEASWK